MTIEHFQIGHIIFKWGDHISDIKSQLINNESMIENENSFSKNQTIKINLPSFLSFKTNSCEFTAPFLDRLIYRVEINIPPQEDDIDTIFKVLSKSFGKPSENYFGENRGAGSVIESCRWRFENCTVYLCFYGGIRSEYGEENIGSIHFDFDDIVMLDALYSNPLRQIEKELINDINLSSIKLFSFGMNQSISWDLSIKNYKSQSPHFISRAFNGFHKRYLLKTPPAIQSRITQLQVCTWISKRGNHYISNYWETTELTNKMETSWSNLLPAKGSGGSYLYIGNLRIKDGESSPEIEKLVHHLENLLNTTIKYCEDYDA